MAKTFLYIGLLILLFYSCKKETGVAGPAGPAGNDGLNGNLLDTGTLSGRLAVYNEFGWPIADSSGVKISLKLNNSDISVLTDKSGNYQFTGLPAGTYNLTYEKSGCGTMKTFGISHFAPSKLPTLVPEVYILENPVKTAVDSISFVDLGTIISLNIYLDTSSLSYWQYYGNFILLVGKDANINTSNTIQSPYSVFISSQTGGYYQVYISKSDIGGQTNITLPYYITVGTYNRYIHKLQNPLTLFDSHNSSDYINPDDGKYVYPNLKLSPNVVLIQ